MLREHRITSGLTQEGLAERSALSVDGIQKLERGVTHPYRDTVERLVRALNLTIEDSRAFREAAPPVRRRGTGWPSHGDYSRPHNLPLAATSFVGRHRELEEVAELLRRGRMLTLVGTGGCGKTRLAIELARSLISEYVDGTWLIDLAPVADPDLVAHEVGAVLGFRETPGQELSQSMAAALQSRHLLLLLDNCEHLLDACAHVAAQLLRSCDGVRILATSREPIHVPGETTWRVPSLDVPADNPDADLAQLQLNPAVRLFLDRALAAQPTFVLTEANGRVVAQICRSLDGMPLAIELAASQTAFLTPRQLADRLSQRFRLLSGGSRMALPRHQTLQATMDWSYQLLSKRERTLFESLSVFAGGWTLDAAEHVCAASSIASDDILDLLGSLVRKSLVVIIEESGEDENRFGYLETVREYARIKQASRGMPRSRALRLRHARYYANLLQELNPAAGEDAVFPVDVDVARLEVEQDNVRTALRWCIDTGRAALALRLANGMWPYWFCRGLFGEALLWFEAALALSGTPRSDERATDPTDFVASPLQVAQAQQFAAPIIGNHGDPDGAMAIVEKSTATLAQIAPGSPLHAAGVVQIGLSFWLAGDHRRSEELLDDALRLSRRAAAGDMAARALSYLGRIALSEGRYSRAAELFNSAAHESPCRGWFGAQLSVETAALLGRTAYFSGAYEEANTCFRRAFELIRENGIGGYALGDSLEWLAALQTRLGRTLEAARLFGAAERMRRVSGSVRWPPYARGYEEDVAELRGQLDPLEFGAAWQEGGSCRETEAVDYAVRLASAGRSSS